MAVAKHQQLVDDLLQELADLPTVSKQVTNHSTATEKTGSRHAIKASLQVNRPPVNSRGTAALQRLPAMHEHGGAADNCAVLCRQ
jgi:hypothetical protein